ncbi:hypothetical protein HK098_007875 [Nowakowskiella sp. JEL0407]|nr:hypothetical protein HK098_007875 [Nowakowskiella sp. JEL0407]
MPGPPLKILTNRNPYSHSKSKSVSGADSYCSSPVSNASSQAYYHRPSLTSSSKNGYENQQGYFYTEMNDYSTTIVANTKIIVPPQSMTQNEDVYSFSKKPREPKDSRPSSPQKIVANPIIFAKPTLRTKKSSHSLKEEKLEKPPASQITASLTEIDHICSLCLGALNQDENPMEIQANDRALRKIMDLEISNTSLLAVNNSLESTIRKQAQTIERLKSQVIHLSGGSLSKDDDFPDEQFEDVSSVPEDELESPNALDMSMGAPQLHVAPAADETQVDLVNESTTISVAANKELKENPVGDEDQAGDANGESKKPDEFDLAYDRIFEKVASLIDECQIALATGNHTSSQSGEGASETAESLLADTMLHNYDTEIVNSLSSKLTTVTALRNQVTDHNKTIAGVKNQSPTSKTSETNVNEIFNQSANDLRSIQLPMTVYSQICTLLEDLHVDFLCASNNVDVTPHYQNPAALQREVLEESPRNETKRDEKKPVESRAGKPVVDKLPYKYLDDPYLLLEQNRKGIPSSVGKGRARRTASNPQLIDESKKSGNRVNRVRHGSASGISYVNPKVQSYDGTESMLSSVVGRR